MRPYIELHLESELGGGVVAEVGQARLADRIEIVVADRLLESVIDQLILRLTIDILRVARLQNMDRHFALAKTMDPHALR